MAKDANNKNPGSEFVKLLTQHERSIFAYILCYVPNIADADEVYQDTAVKMWERFDSDFTLGTNFLAWANTIAYYQILTFRHKHKADRLVFSDDFINAVAREMDKGNSWRSNILTALNECIKKLPKHSVKLLTLIYDNGFSIADASEELKIQVAATYKRLARIRLSLHKCIKRELKSYE